jgi:multidrug efflux pump subunit AcrA (membrane-fusion protein)
MMASVELRDYVAYDAIMIPNKLILQDTKGVNYTYVFINQNESLGIVERRNISLGMSNEKMTEVLDGIKSTDQIINRGIRSVQSGETVKLY